MGRPTKAQQIERKRQEAARFQRIMRGRVVMLVWPADPSKGEQHHFCSGRCILNANDWDYGDPIKAYAERKKMVTTEWDKDYDIIRNGHWPLTRYKIERPYAADVDGVRCWHCKGPLRAPLTPQKRKALAVARREKARQRREWARTMSPLAQLKARFAASRTPEQVDRELRQQQAAAAERRESNRKRMAAKRAKGRRSSAERAEAARAAKEREARLQRQAAEDALARRKDDEQHEEEARAVSWAIAQREAGDERLLSELIDFNLKLLQARR